MAATRRLGDPMRCHTYYAFVGLLISTGLRVGEAIRLDCHDLDPDAGLLRVVDSKFGKSREIPLHASTVGELDRYRRRRDRCWPGPKSPAFFLNAAGTRLAYSTVRSTFQGLLRHAGLRTHPGRGNPRIHDTRHTFAVNTLIGWYRDGADVNALLPLLSTYLGHVDPKSTYWYLSATPELLGLAAQRLEDTFEVTR
jgi:integrase